MSNEVGFEVEELVMEVWAPPHCRAGCSRDSELIITAPMWRSDGKISGRGTELSLCRPCALALGAKLLGEAL